MKLILSDTTTYIDNDGLHMGMITEWTIFFIVKSTMVHINYYFKITVLSVQNIFTHRWPWVEGIFVSVLLVCACAGCVRELEIQSALLELLTPT